jgi:hypothetical protein
MSLRLQSQRICSLIPQLEEARTAGTLGSLLTHIEKDRSTDEIVALYKKFVDKPFITSRFRAEHVQAITRKAVQLIRDPVIIFRGTLHKQQVVDQDTDKPLDRWVISTVEPGGLVLRRDQARSARYWGIGFDLNSDGNNNLLEEYLLQSSVCELVSMLRDLEIVEPQFRMKKYESSHILPSGRAADFEQLLIDILNEHGLKARHAPLVEDLLEKTDVRVHLESVHRRRGARVQVTAASDPLAYQSKLAMINRLEEIIILSPASIARFASDTGKEVGVSTSHRSATALLNEQAIAIRDSLFAALNRRQKSPLGPLASVPNDLRTVIREFIELEAIRSTDALREREVRKGKIRTWSGLLKK